MGLRQQRAHTHTPKKGRIFVAGRKNRQCPPLLWRQKRTMNHKIAMNDYGNLHKWRRESYYKMCGAIKANCLLKRCGLWQRHNTMHRRTAFGGVECGTLERQISSASKLACLCVCVRARRRWIVEAFYSTTLLSSTPNQYYHQHQRARAHMHTANKHSSGRCDRRKATNSETSR